MFCKNCGQVVDEKANYCKECGAKIELEGGKKKTSGFSIAGFVLSLAGLAFSGIVCGVLAIIFSSIGLYETAKKQYNGKKFAISGLIVGIIATVYNIVLLVLIFVLKIDALQFLISC